MVEVFYCNEESNIAELPLVGPTFLAFFRADPSSSLGQITIGKCWNAPSCFGGRFLSWVCNNLFTNQKHWFYQTSLQLMLNRKWEPICHLILYVLIQQSAEWRKSRAIAKLSNSFRVICVLSAVSSLIYQVQTIEPHIHRLALHISLSVVQFLNCQVQAICPHLYCLALQISLLY